MEVQNHVKWRVFFSALYDDDDFSPNNIPYIINTATTVTIFRMRTTVPAFVCISFHSFSRETAAYINHNLWSRDQIQ